jgi:hypothetical protein
MNANVDQRVKFGLKIWSKSFGWMTLRNNSCVISGLEQMIAAQADQRKALNPKRGVGGGGN